MDILMPQLGETVSEGKIVRWFKSVGDDVKPGDNLCEIETDKVTVEVPATEPGVLSAINVEAGVVAAVGTVIAVVGKAGSAPAGTSAAKPAAARSPANGGAPSKEPEAKPAAPPSAPPAAEPSPAGRRDLDPFREVRTPLGNYGPARQANGAVATPLARRLAAGAAMDLAAIAGSGPRGRITGRDVEKAIAARPAGTPSLARAETFEEMIGDIHRGRPHEVMPVDGMRRTIARRLGQSKATVPHFYLTADIALERLSRMRAEANAGAPKGDDGTPAWRLSVNDFLVRALALALQEVPAANAMWAGDGILRFTHSDIGVAVAVEGGLFTPVVHEAERKPLSAISAEVRDLADRARKRALQPHEYQGGTASLSNLGMYGVREFAAIINPPQSSILAVGAAHRHAVEAENGGIAFIDQITATLSCDHRVIDGVTGAELLAAFRALVENPMRMVV